MHLIPDNPKCNVCDDPATIHLIDTTTSKEYLCCRAHTPTLWPGMNSHLVIQRYRSPLNSTCSQAIKAHTDSSEHQSFKEEMCVLRILGGVGAAKYYLSRLTGSDQYALWSDEFEENMREFLVQQTQGEADCFPFDCNSIDFMAPLLKQVYLHNCTDGQLYMTRQELAVVLLLRNPTWSDEQIAREVPTTVKQLQKNTDYKALKSLVKKGHAY